MKIISLCLFILLLFTSCSAQRETRSDFVPDWAKEAIYYQIFPERFANGDSTNDPPNIEKWDGIPKGNNYFGGDIQGIIDHLDYLKDLGINALYLNPIFESNTNHKYHTIDYFKIDPHFGDEKTFKTLIDESHKRGIRVIIDGVFNHTGTEFFAFKDIIKNEKNSEYLKWYNVHDFPIKLPPEKPNYEAWWGMGELPKLMADNPDVRKYLFEATRYWMKLGLDGWRLDVPNEMSHDFWIEWRKIVKEENPDALIIGEIWDDASPWLKGDQFDAVMNYRFRGACVGFIALENRNAFQFDSILTTVNQEYPREVSYALQNLIGSHDTERFLMLCENDTAKLKLAIVAQLMYLGAPMIYYGDEIGTSGGKDPDCRKTMRWDNSTWNFNLLNWYQTHIKIRTEHKIFSRGTVRFIMADTLKNIAAFVREYENSVAVVILNMSKDKNEINYSILPEGINEWLNLYDDTTLRIDNGNDKLFDIQAKSSLILLGKKD
ncbi:MAG: glycoside hydrolase family 13 protein [Ignavibacteriales bacterium]|nr:glycoside hydrolase family 13 protein [Ignavibacteriales bacterium]